MHEYRTEFPVRNHLGAEILPTDTPLNAATRTRLARLPAERKTVSMAADSSIRKDLLGVLHKAPYSAIFAAEETRSLIQDSFSALTVPVCEFETLRYFKELDPLTYEHLLAVFSLSTYIGTIMKTGTTPAENFLGSLSHDIGKCSIPLEILHKRGPLTPAERRYIRHHTLAGYALLTHFSGNPAGTETARIARDHHENRVGTGYPAGVRRVDAQTRIVIVCDIYDALVSPRTYRTKPYDNRTALEELSKRVETGELDAAVVQALIAGNRGMKDEWFRCRVSGEYRGHAPAGNNYGLTADDEGED